MRLPRIVIATTGFVAARTCLEEALPGVELTATTTADLCAKGCEAEVIIPTMGRIDGEVMDRVRGVRLIQQWGAGLEGVDIAAATRRGIPVANVPTGGTGNAESVAEWCIMAALALSRYLPQLGDSMRAGGAWGAPMGRALIGRTAGIVGLGGIGCALAARLKPFGMRLLGVKRRGDPAAAERLGLEWVGTMDQLPVLLRQSEYLFVCVPLNQETRNLVDEEALALLPDQACVINPARGGVISEKALLAAIEAGRLLGAGLDVFEQEPLDPRSPLLARREIVATPHIAGATDASYRGIAARVAENILRLARGEELRCCVNRDALASR